MIKIKNPATEQELLSLGAEFRSFGEENSVAIVHEDDQKIIYLRKSDMYFLID